MSRYRFVIIGSGWRAGYYIRIAKALPDVFELCNVYCRSREKAGLLHDEYDVPCTISEEECLLSDPDFVVVAVSKASGAEVAMKWLDKGCTVLMETPAGLDEDTLLKLRNRADAGQKLVVAEQYTRYPQYAALLKLINKGLIGEVTCLNISLAHEYHGASLMKSILGITPKDRFSVYCRTYSFPTVETLTRYEKITGGKIKDKSRTIAIFEFENGKVAFYDFDSEQYRSPIRRNSYKIQGVKGEIIDGSVYYLDENNQPIEGKLEIKTRTVNTASTNPNLRQFKEIEKISFAGETLYEPPFGLCGLSDDETAIACMMRETAEYSRGNASTPYSVTEAVADSDMAILMRKAQESGSRIGCTNALFLMPCVTAHAGGYDLQEHYDKMKAKRAKQEREYMEKWLDDLEADGNLTQAAIDAAGEYGRGRTPNHKSTQSSAGTYSGGGSGSSAYTGPGKGWVYSVDELHVIGLPEGENGYTKPGWYGDIE